MGKILEYILELTGLIGILGMVSYIKWTQMALGATLALLGAYYPELRKKRKEVGKTEIAVGKYKFTLHGTLRFALIICGLILIIGSVVNGQTELMNNSK